MKKNSKLSRILAWIGMIIIIADILYMLYSSFTGKNFFVGVYLIIIIPVIIWAILFFSGQFKKDEEEFGVETDKNDEKQ